MGGWAYINDGDVDDLELYVEDWKLFDKSKPEIEDLPGDERVGFDLDYHNRTLVLEGVLFDSRGDAEDCIKLINEWNADEPYGIKIRVTSGGSYFKQDGVNEELLYLCIDKTEIMKATRGDEQLYRIGRLLFKQAG